MSIHADVTGPESPGEVVEHCQSRRVRERPSRRDCFGVEVLYSIEQVTSHSPHC